MASRAVNININDTLLNPNLTVRAKATKVTLHLCLDRPYKRNRGGVVGIRVSSRVLVQATKASHDQCLTLFAHQGTN